MSEIYERLKFTPQAPDPEATLKTEHRNLVSDYLLDWSRGYRDAPPKPYEAWKADRLAPEKARAEAQKQAETEANEAKQAHETAATNRAELAALEKKLSVAKVEAIDRECRARGIDPRADLRARGKVTRELSKLGII